MSRKSIVLPAALFALFSIYGGQESKPFAPTLPNSQIVYGQEPSQETSRPDYPKNQHYSKLIPGNSYNNYVKIKIENDKVEFRRGLDLLGKIEEEITSIDTSSGLIRHKLTWSHNYRGDKDGFSSYALSNGIYNDRYAHQLLEQVLSYVRDSKDKPMQELAKWIEASLGNTSVHIENEKKSRELAGGSLENAIESVGREGTYFSSEDRIGAYVYVMERNPKRASDILEGLVNSDKYSSTAKLMASGLYDNHKGATLGVCRELYQKNPYALLKLLSSDRGEIDDGLINHDTIAKSLNVNIKSIIESSRQKVAEPEWKIISDFVASESHSEARKSMYSELPIEDLHKIFMNIDRLDLRFDLRTQKIPDDVFGVAFGLAYEGMSLPIVLAEFINSNPMNAAAYFDSHEGVYNQASYIGLEIAQRMNSKFRDGSAKEEVQILRSSSRKINDFLIKMGQRV